MRKAVSRIEFFTACTLVSMVLLFLEMLIIISMSRSMEFSRELKFLGGLAVVNVFILAPLLTVGGYRMMGLSVAHTTVEGFRPASFTHANDLDRECGTVELRYSNATRVLMILGAIMFVTLFAISIAAMFFRSGESRLGLLGAALFFGVLAAGSIGSSFGTVVRADERGMSSYAGPFSLCKTFVSWDRIATCDIVTVNAFGKTTVEYPLLKDARGRVIFKSLGMNLSYVDPADRARLIELVRARFPKKNDDNWVI